ncbi:GCN5 family acetyltransferase [Peribacillus butanolivorans]|uniref:GNAT family N-acetyltransferase n=1 Tax=Peribacillus butanolivorans TaxID=421767 RepID=UPI0006A6A4E3|nr:GNAT family N-acetyltransferase [Peribacillus butanolivorans]KON69789.1 GCN5 family acetyltransferase [Peribacillus butanolivorans]
MAEVLIVPYNSEYKEDLKRLSYEWLEKYVSVEPEDEKIINNPEEVVLNCGGFIFFAKYNIEIVGTVSLIKLDGENAFELAKLAVTEKYQGLKIGRRLMEKCIEVAKLEGASKIVLFTNHKLTAAIELYKKFGFSFVSLKNIKYLEADLKMELEI